MEARNAGEVTTKVTTIVGAGMSLILVSSAPLAMVRDAAVNDSRREVAEWDGATPTHVAQLSSDMSD